MHPAPIGKGFSEDRPRGRSASFTAMHTSAIGPGLAICTIGLKGPVLEIASSPRLSRSCSNLESSRLYGLLQGDHRDAGGRIEKELRAIDGRHADLGMKKQRVMTSTSPATFPAVSLFERRRSGIPSRRHRPDEPRCKARSATLFTIAKSASIMLVSGGPFEP